MKSELTDAEYLLYIAERDGAIIGNLPDGRKHVERLQAIARSLAILDGETRMCLKGYLLGHEVDIAMDINDYGDLAPPFEALFGRKPGAPK